jgi:flagellar basal body P-ring protein FlgI
VTLDLNNDRRRMNVNTARQPVILVILVGLAASLAAGGCTKWLSKPATADPMNVPLDDDLTSTDYVGEIAQSWGLGYAKVEGIGLVNSLAGTGGMPADSWQRDHLVDEMRTHGVPKINEILGSKATSMVLIRGLIPPAAKAGDRFDLQVRTAPNSDTTSLAGGFLMPTRMRPMVRLGSRTREGHVIALGTGPLIVMDALDRHDEQSLVQAIIPGGGVVTVAREIGLNVRGTDESLKTVLAITNAINERFTTIDGGQTVGVANAKSSHRIDLAVPNEYRHNVHRYIQVILCVGYGESSQQRLDRIDQLERQLQQSALAQDACMKLEAIGRDATAALKRSLRSPDPRVRFHGAEALAYMQIADGVDELQIAALSQPAFRSPAFAALESLNDVRADIALESLLHADSAETRYGAFRAMVKRKTKDQVVTGQVFPKMFSLHTVASDTKPLIHVAINDRQEIVVFNDQLTFSPRLLYVEQGHLTVRATGPGQVEVARYGGPGGGEQVERCSSRVVDVIAALGKLECSYETVLAVLKQAREDDALPARLVINALPAGRRVYDPDAPVLMGQTADNEAGSAVVDLFDDSATSEGEPFVEATAEVSTDAVDDPNLPVHTAELADQPQPAGWRKLVPWLR